MRWVPALLLLVLGITSVARPQSVEVASLEERVMALSNQVRQSNGLPRVTGNELLNRAARSHSEEMARLNFFGHESPNVNRRFPWDRVNLAGADADGISENLYLAEGHPLTEVATLAVRSWEKSPEHRHNLLDPRMTDAGVGVALHGGQVYVTQLFSSPLSAPP